MEYEIFEIRTGERIFPGLIAPITNRSFETYLIPANDFSFVAVVQTNFEERELQAFSNSCIFYAVDTLGVVDVMFDINNCITFDVAINAAAIVNVYNYKPFETGKGMSFHLVFADKNGIVQKQRLFSLTTAESNQLVSVLNNYKNINPDENLFNERLNDFYQKYGFEEIRKDSFITHKT